MIYLLMFIASCFATNLAQKATKKKQYYLFSVIAILLPCLLAAMRHISIGVDVTVYVTTLVDAVLNSNNIFDFYQSTYSHASSIRSVLELEIGFTFIVYFFAKLTRSVNVVLFVIEALIIVPVYFGLMKIKTKSFPVWLSMLAFYTLCYNTSYNIMRQYIALAILFYGVMCLFENKSCAFFKFLAVACFFHLSGLVGLPIYFVYRFVVAKKKIKFNIFPRVTVSASLIVIFVALASAIIVFNNEIIIWGLNTFLNGKFTGYINGNVQFMPNQFLIRLPLFLLLVMNWKKLSAQYKNLSFFAIMVWFDFLMGQFYSVSSFGGRIGAYFEIYSIVLVGYVMSLKSNDFKSKINLAIILFYLGFYWVYYICIGNSGGTFPYLFWFQN